jgi:hypothetical protein
VVKLVAVLFLAGCWDIDALQHLYQPNGAPDFAGQDLAGVDFAGADLAAPDLAASDLAGADLASADLTVATPPDMASRWVVEETGDHFKDVYALGGHVYALAIGSRGGPQGWVLHHRDPAGIWSDEFVTADNDQSQARVVALATNNLYLEAGLKVYHSSGDGNWSVVLAPADEDVFFVAGLGNQVYAGSYGDLSTTWGAIRSSTGGAFSTVSTPGCVGFLDGFGGNGTVTASAQVFDCTSKQLIGYALLVSTGGAFANQPLPNATIVLGMWASSASNLYVGLYNEHVVGHLQGAAWALEPIPSEGGDDSDVRALAGTDPANIWGITLRGQAIHFDGSAWSGELPLGQILSAAQSDLRVAVAGPDDVHITINGTLRRRR